MSKKIKKKISQKVRIEKISKINSIECTKNWKTVFYNVWIEAKDNAEEEEIKWIDCDDINDNDLKSKKWGKMLNKLHYIDPKLESHDDVMARCKLMKGKFCGTKIHFDVDNGKNVLFNYSFRFDQFGGHKIDFIISKILDMYRKAQKGDVYTQHVCFYILFVHSIDECDNFFIFYLCVDMMRISV